MPSNGRDGASRASLALALASINDLLVRGVDDAVQLGDVWVRINDAMDAYVREGRIDLDHARVFAVFTNDPTWLMSLPDSVRTLVIDLRHDNQVLGARVRAAVQAGRLDAGVCGWLADLCLFHWNRMGLPRNEVQPLVAAITDVSRRPL
jgi:hypothetical protein